MIAERWSALKSTAVSGVNTIANRLLRPAGLMVRPIPADQRPMSPGGITIPPPRTYMGASLRHLRALGYCPSYIVDVGAGQGTRPLLRTWPKVATLWIEPLREFEPKLQALAAEYPGRYRIAAAGEFPGPLTLHVHDRDFYGSSLMRESDGPKADGQSREVPIVRLDDEVDFAEAGDEILLKVDVQGAELMVLAGAHRVLAQSAAVVLETSFFQFHQGAPIFREVVEYMHARGFEVYDIFGLENRLLDGALAQCDVLFVKEAGRFRLTHAWATPDQRARFQAVLGNRGE